MKRFRRVALFMRVPCVETLFSDRCVRAVIGFDSPPPDPLSYPGTAAVTK